MTTEATSNPTENTIVPNTPPVPELDVAATKAKIQEQEDLAFAEMTAVEEAVKKSDIRGMMAHSDKAKAALAMAEKLKKSIERAEYDLRREERQALVDQFVANVPGLFGGINVGDVRALSITGLSVSFNEDGTVTCTVNTKGKEAAPGEKRAKGTGGAKGRITWMLNGAEYKSRELIEAFGGPAGVEALDKADNPEKFGLKFSPGFNTFVVKLAADIGAERVETAAA